MTTTKDNYNRKWIIENAVTILDNYGDTLTLRALYYRLVADYGMTNSQKHYKRVGEAMVAARWDGTVPFEAFVDHEREVLGATAAEETDVDEKIDSSKFSIDYWMKNYSKNRWENQPIYPEVFIEKKALQGVFEKPCSRLRVALSACKGYPSLTFLNEAADRFNAARDRGQEPVILYFGDHDPSGDDIPISLAANLERMGCPVRLERIALTKEQVIEMGLPPAPIKSTDSRSDGWDGVGQVELDAIAPPVLQEMVSDAIKELFDNNLYEELLEQTAEEKVEYVAQLKEYVANL